MRLGDKLTKRSKNETKFKIQPIIFKPNIYKHSEKTFAFNKKNYDEITIESDFGYTKPLRQKRAKDEENLKKITNILRNQKFLKPLKFFAVI